ERTHRRDTVKLQYIRILTLRRSQLVGHEIVWRTEELLGGIVPQTGNSAHVKVGVTLDLSSKTAQFAPFLQQRAPVLVVGCIDALLEFVEACIELSNPTSRFVERRFHANCLGVRVACAVALQFL